MFKKASIIYMKESLDFFIEFVSENITEEELEDIANSTLDNLLRKIVETN
jgi:predicted nucleic acid-binding OB-fold protein